MKELPLGFYAVQCDFDNCPDKTVFEFKGVKYAVKEGENLFGDVVSAVKAAVRIPECGLEGFEYERFTTPVLLFSPGEHRTHNVTFDRSITLLGANAGVYPNLPSAGGAFPEADPRREEGETVLHATYDFRHYSVTGADTRLFIIDGFSMRWPVFYDPRNSGGRYDLVFRNLVYRKYNGFNHFNFAPSAAEDPIERHVVIENVRMVDYDDLDYGASFVLPRNRSTLLKNVAIKNTNLLFGFSGILNSVSVRDANLPETELRMEDCFIHDDASGFLRFNCGSGGSRFSFTAKNCSFKNVGTADCAAFIPDTRTPGCEYLIKDCRFVNDRDITPRFMSSCGEGGGVTVENTAVEGYDMTPGHEIVPPSRAPERITLTGGFTPLTDPHKAWIPGSDELNRLDEFYAGRRAFYGDLHVHTKCGGTSDGNLDMALWPSHMDLKHVDFAVIVDHRQMRGYFLPEWNEERFVMGTEPGASVKELRDEHCAMSMVHYNMLFPHKYGLAMVLANFPEYNFRGDELTGKFGYPSFTPDRFRELTEYVQSIGGMMVHPHPKILLSSKDPLDYCFADHIYLETIYGSPYSETSVKDYELWTKLLDMGKHVYASGGSDTHSEVSNFAVSTFYTKERSGKAFFDQMHSGDFTVGYHGMKMLVGDSPMGSESPCRPGDVLLLRVGDPFLEHIKKDGCYELRVYSDRGLAFASVFDGRTPQTLALGTADRRFYRAEVADLACGVRVSIGNPVWLDA